MLSADECAAAFTTPMNTTEPEGHDEDDESESKGVSLSKQNFTLRSKGIPLIFHHRVSVVWIFV